MTDQSPSSEQHRIQAAELYAKGCKLEAQRDYQGALKHYEESLDLYYNELVQAAYLKVLAAVGPL